MTSTGVRFPFSVELKEQHDALRATLGWMEAEIRGKGARVLAERGFQSLLSAWRIHLRQHFRFEEEAGFDGAVTSSDGDVRALAGDLVRQHRALEARLDGLLDRVAAPPGAEDPTELLLGLGRFFRQLRQHDALEDALLQRLAHGPGGLA